MNLQARAGKCLEDLAFAVNDRERHDVIYRAMKAAVMSALNEVMDLPNDDPPITVQPADATPLVDAAAGSTPESTVPALVPSHPSGSTA